MNALAHDHGIAAPDPAQCAGVRTTPLPGQDPLWWVLAARGGSGATTLAAWWEPAGDAGRDWPAGPGESPYVVIAARGTLTGLTAAHALVRQWRTGLVPEHLVLLGVVVTADRPGRVPTAIRLQRDKVAALAGERLWWIDYRDEVASSLPTQLPLWRIGDPPLRRTDPREAPPPEVTRAAHEITALVYDLEYPAPSGEPDR